jgi:hypothetical protein
MSRSRNRNRAIACFLHENIGDTAGCTATRIERRPIGIPEYERGLCVITIKYHCELVEAYSCVSITKSARHFWRDRIILPTPINHDKVVTVRVHFSKFHLTQLFTLTDSLGVNQGRLLWLIRAA